VNITDYQYIVFLHKGDYLISKVIDNNNLKLLCNSGRFMLPDKCYKLPYKTLCSFWAVPNDTLDSPNIKCYTSEGSLLQDYPEFLFR